MVGNFNDKNVVFALLPRCLRNGGNPTSGYLDPFPVYNGPAAPHKLVGTNSIVAGKDRTEYISSRGDLLLTPYEQFNSESIRVNFSQTVDPVNSFSVHSVLDFSEPTGIDTGIPWVLSASVDGNDADVAIQLLQHGGLIEDLPSLAVLAIFNGTPYDPLHPELSTYQAPYILSNDAVTGVHTLDLVKSGTSYLLYFDEVLLTDTYAPFAVGDPNLLGTFGPLYWGNLNYYQSPTYTSAHIFYNSALSNNEISQLISLGPDLGGLCGYDNGDGTMALQTTKRKTFIGKLETTDMSFAVLPSCLRNGANPAPYGIDPNGSNRPKFPLYAGPSAPSDLEGDVPIYTSIRPSDNRILYDTGRLRLTCFGFDSVTFAQGGIVKNFQFSNTPTNAWSIVHTVDLSNPTAVTDQDSYMIAYVGNPFMVAITASYGFIEAPYMILIQVGLADNSIYCDLFYPLQTEDVAGIKNFVITKDAEVFKVYMNAVELPLALAYGNTMQEALEATKDIPQPIDMTVFDDDNLYVHGDVNDPQHYDVSQMTQFPSVSVYNGPFPNWVINQVYYNRALAQEEITTNFNLGNDFGKLRGYDNGDGTMGLFAPPEITTQPKVMDAVLGQSATFSVVVLATDPHHAVVTYQWYKNGVVIPGAISATFTIALVTLQDYANYSVVATDGVALLISDSVPLRQTFTIPVGQVGTTTNVPGIGDVDVSYSWKLDPNTNLPSGTTQNVTL